MRVAMLGPIAWSTPPAHYGPWERVTGLLTEGLIARGVEVTLFATADSQTTARLDAVAPHGYATDPGMDGRVWEALHVARALERSGEFDLIHNQLDWLPLAFSASWRAPMVTTIHGFSGSAILPAYAASASRFVAISDSDRSPLLDYVATIHHGIDMQAFTVVERPGGALLSFGRIHPDKGTADAIQIARIAGRPLIICGPIHDAEYFAREVEPHIDGVAVEYLGSVGSAERDRILGSGAALLHPISFDEPFGLSLVEAMACGTPVIAYRRGSMEDVVDVGVTGYLVDDVAQAAAAVPAAVALDRTRVRATAERRFGVDRMVDEYLEVYRRMLGEHGRAHSQHRVGRAT